MVWFANIVCCFIGAASVLASYSRYCWLAGPYPVASAYWPLVGSFLAGPFVLTIFAAWLAKRNRSASWLLTTVGATMAALSLAERLVPVPIPLKDSEIVAALRLEGISFLQYLVSAWLFFVARSTRNESLSGVRDDQETNGSPCY